MYVLLTFIKVLISVRIKYFKNNLILSFFSHFITIYLYLYRKRKMRHMNVFFKNEIINKKLNFLLNSTKITPHLFKVHFFTVLLNDKKAKWCKETFCIQSFPYKRSAVKPIIALLDKSLVKIKSRFYVTFHL